MKRRILLCLCVFVSYVALSVLTSPLRGGYFEIFGLQGMPLYVLICMPLFFILTLLFLYACRNKMSITGFMLSGIAGILILDLPFRIMAFDSTLISLPCTVCDIAATIGACCVFGTRKTAYKVIAISLVLGACLWTSYVGYDLWLNKLYFNTSTGAVTQKLEASPVFQDSENQDVILNDSETEYVVLDFWSSSCGGCFREFPKVQELYDALSNRPEVKLYSVFCRSSKKGETAKWGVDKLTELGYTFPTVSIDFSAPEWQEMEINRFPAVLIIDPENTIVFRGSISLAKRYLTRLTKSAE